MPSESPRIPAPTVHFQGRERELDRLGRALERHRVVVITGMAGIGKTTLALRTAQMLPPGIAPLWVKASENGGGDRLLADLAEHLGLSLQPDAAAQARAQAALWALESAGRVLVVDDLHLAVDPAGLALVVAYLTHARSGRLLATAREAPDLSVDQRAEMFTLALGGLTEPQTRALVSSLLADAAPGDVARVAAIVYRRTRGHPHFVRHLVAHVAARGMDAGPARAAPGFTTPELDRFLDEEVLLALSASEREVIAVMAVLGEPAPPALIAAACGRQGREPARSMERLLRRGLIEPGPALTQGLHAQVATAVLRGLSPERRVEIEASVGEALLAHSAPSPLPARDQVPMDREATGAWSPPSSAGMEIAGYAHLLAAGQAQRVAREVMPALVRAHRAGLIGEVLSLLDALAARIDPLPASLCIERARALKVRGRHAQALAQLEGRLAGVDGALRIRMLAVIGDIHSTAGHYALAEGVHRKALALARSRRDRGAIADGLGDLAAVDFYMGRIARSLALGRRALALARTLGDRAREASALNTLAAALRHQGRLADALGLYRECLAIDETLGDLTGSASTYHNLGIVAMLLDRDADALAAFERAARLKERLGARASLANTLRHCAEAALAAGDAPGARAHIERAQSLLGEDDRVLGAYIAGTAAMVALAQGEPARAGVSIERGLALVPRAGAARAALGLWRKKAEIALVRREPAEALAALRRAIALARGIDDSVEMVAVHRLAAQAALMRDAPRQARDALARARALLPREGMGLERGWIEVLTHLASPREAASDATSDAADNARALTTLTARLGGNAAVEPTMAARYLLVSALEAAALPDRARCERAALLEATRPAALARLAAVEERLLAMRVPLAPLFDQTGPDGSRPAGARQVSWALAGADGVDLVLDLHSEVLSVRGTEVPGFLARKLQGALLASLMRAGRRAVSKQSLYEDAWKARYNPEIHDNTVYVRINHLRALLKPLLGIDPIHTDPESSTYRLAPRTTYLLIAPR